MIKKLAGCIREYKLPSILTAVFITFEVLMETIIPLLMAELIDKGIEGNGGDGDLRKILIYGGIIVLMALASLAFGVLSGRYAAVSSCGFGKNLRHDMYYNLQDFAFSNIDKFSTASLVTRLTTDVTNVQNSYQMIIRTAVRGPVMIIMAVIMSFRIHPKMSLIFLLIVPILAGGLYLIMSSVHKIFRQAFKIFDKLNRVVQENLRGMRVVKSFVREDYEENKFNEVSQRIFADFTKAENIIALNSPLMLFCVYTCMLLIAWVGAKNIIAEEMTTGELMSMITYTMQILMSLMMLSMIVVMLTISRASAERIVEVLDEKSNLTNGENPVYEVKDGLVVFKDVNFSYVDDEERLCLKDIDLEIKSGETIGIIGGTGSAKSTLVQMIPRLYDVTGGSVMVGGRDVREYDLETLRNEVAMVLQKNVLFSGTIKENLRWGDPDATDEQLIHACELAQADGFIRSFPDGYDTYIEQGGANVSGGQKQRLCIARALLKKPKILILDDSTSAVDTATDALIRKAFREEIPDTTKFIIAQRIASVQDADKIIVMENGAVAAFGTHEQLLETSEIYREVYTSQTKGGAQDE